MSVKSIFLKKVELIDNWWDFNPLHHPPRVASQEIPDSAFCAMLDNPDKFPLWEVSTCVFFTFPMLIMVVLYSRMGLKIRSRSRHTLALGESHSKYFFFRGSLFVSIKLNCYYRFAAASRKQIAFLYDFLWFHRILKFSTVFVA